MTRVLGIIGIALLAACSSEVAEAPPAAVTLEFLADYNIGAGTLYDEDELGGISGIVFVPGMNRWIGLSDSRRRSRYYELTVQLDSSDFRVVPSGAHYFIDGNGDAIAENILDPEGVAMTPWGTLLISTEADWRSEPVEQAKLLEVELGGRVVRSFDVPEKFLVEGSPPEKGVRHNLAFESLTLSADGSRLFVAAEGALVQDGPEASFDTVGFSRLIEYEVRDRELREVAEYVYPVGPIAPAPGFEDADVFAGLVELIALDHGELIALERIFIREKDGEKRSLNRIRLYLVDLTEASDVSRIASLDDDASWTPVQKELLVDFDDIVPELSPGFQRLDNFEAMGLGPELPDGGRCLLVVSDDNFQETQRSAFLLFRLTEAFE